MPSQEEIVNAVARQLASKDLSQQAVMILQKSTARVLERIKQNVDAQVKEDSSPIVEDFVRNVAGKMSNMTQQWADGVKNDLVVFPEGTRYIFRDGSMTTIIIEQPPQVRHINVYGKMYLLSMPYVQFTLTLKNHKLQGDLHEEADHRSRPSGVLSPLGKYRRQSPSLHGRLQMERSGKHHRTSQRRYRSILARPIQLR